MRPKRGASVFRVGRREVPPVGRRKWISRGLTAREPEAQGGQRRGSEDSTMDLLIKITSNKGRRIGDRSDQRRGLPEERLPNVYIMIVGFLFSNSHNNASSGKGGNSPVGRRCSGSRGGDWLPLYNVRLWHCDLWACGGWCRIWRFGGRDVET